MYLDHAQYRRHVVASKKKSATIMREARIPIARSHRLLYHGVKVREEELERLAAVLNCAPADLLLADEVQS